MVESLASMTGRSKARAVVLQILYQDDLNPQRSPSADEEMLRRQLRHPELIRFAEQLLAGVRKFCPEIDKRIISACDNWALSRIAVTDRNALRIGAYELLYSDTPPRVAINEAVELAKLFGSQQSGPFVNGILDRLYRELLADQAGSQGQQPTEARS